MEQQIERSKVVVRWIVAGVLFATVSYLKRQGLVTTPWSVVVGLTAGVAALNIIYWTILRSAAPRWLKYLTTGTDLVLISLLLLFTGGSASVFYVAYFVVLVSNSIRYGMGMAVYVSIMYNVAFVMVLLLKPPATDLTIEAVRILAFWGVALYAGYLASRFQRQARILESYEETIARLRAELATMRHGK